MKTFLYAICLAFIASLTVVTPAQAAQVDYFLKIDGVEGESKAKPQKGIVKGGALFLVGEDGKQFLAPDGRYKRQQDGKIIQVKGHKMLLPAIQKIQPNEQQNPKRVIAPIDSNRIVAPTDSNSVRPSK